MKKIRHLTSTKSAAAFWAVFILLAGVIATPFVHAQTYQQQIDNLNSQNANTQNNLYQLGAQATDLNAVIAQLQAEIDNLQTQIVANQTKHDETVVKIAEAEAELVRQRGMLGENIKAMYLEGEITTMEMLLSSNDLSEFVDREQSRNSVKDKIKETLDTINALKAQLVQEKETLARILNDLRVMQEKVATQRAEQNRLLNLNQAQQGELNSQIKNNNSQIAELRRKQAAENARLFGNSSVISGGACSPRPQNSYPDRWCAIAQDSVIDSWGMYNRECVSYTAWKVAESGRHMPYWGGVGNANQWDDNARRAGIPVDGSPRVGDVAVSNAGYYGHVMYVEAVYGDGTIYISQYNWNLNGTYSEARISAAGLVFIHF